MRQKEQERCQGETRRGGKEAEAGGRGEEEEQEQVAVVDVEEEGEERGEVKGRPRCTVSDMPLQSTARVRAC